MAHDRATHLDREFPGLLLHLYGHIHTFDVRERAGTTYVNTSALDRILAVTSKRDRRRVRYVNAGNYAVIEVDQEWQGQRRVQAAQKELSEMERDRISSDIESVRR